MKTAGRRRWLLAFATLTVAFFLAKTTSWIISGCPMGFALGSCLTGMSDGRQVSASTDHLLDVIHLQSDRELVVIDLGATQVVVRGDTATVDRRTRFVLPASCKKVEFDVRGDRLLVMADEKQVGPAGRPPGSGDR